MLLLHGLGATGGVWHADDGVAPDLPGHGAAPWHDAYSFDAMAEAVLPLLGDEPATVVGHSMGGVVALALAAKAPDRVRRVVGLGIKVAWSAEDVERARALAARPVATYDTRGAAVERFLRVSGLAGLVPPDDPMTDDAVVDRVAAGEGSGWRLAQDPRTFGVGVPDLAGLLASVTCEVVLARGEHDRMVSHDQLAALVPDPVTLRGLGHNAHVEDRAAVLALG
ncbi:alpha/beta hydrolase [Nocardioides flavus (ex Wang et al. 2016)]|uniref:Alpha/beta hydrolase n=1 Tax=Nocardioides flavus (ex Wang et al. 2016) TaxID=2058780 RepID=A0ABQ3HLH8_9ACTN|nr:alpha/beta fold hydrolase [Nocardioides flavus (ex Wang et al. 2016)]GHE18081.1 alpha/beta hydrolase [Nocardioides flavus (ex Wang et al. 2016)]